MSLTSGDGAGRRRAAVIGASGIGKHHAKWYHLAGCDVVALCGSSQSSAERTARALEDLFGFAGRPYWDVAEMLEKEQPELVSVATPPELHRDHAVAALTAGAHVMCEKPLVWDKCKDAAGMLADAEAICATAEAKDRLLAANTQYVAGAEQYVASVLDGERPSAVNSYFMQIDSRGARGPVDREQIWIDLASHPISVLLAFVPDGEMRAGSLQCRIEEKRVVARFEYVSPMTGTCEVEIVVRNLPEGDLVRRFGINGRLVDYEGRNDENGVYCAYLTDNARETKHTDFVQTSLERFVQAARGPDTSVLATGRGGLRNLEMQLVVLESGTRNA